MKAVILSGGFGTRLRPLTINTPKSMIPVLNIPFLEYLIKRLKSHKVSDIALAVSYLAEPIKNYFGDGSRFDVKLSYTVEEIPLGTAGAVKNAGGFIDEPTLVFNGDVFTDLDLTDMMENHKRNKAMLTIALTPVEDPTSYGLVETDSNNRILRFLEKPSPDEITTNMINAGTYILEPEVMSLIPAQTNCSFERDIFPLLLRNKEDVFAYPTDCYWMDIGKPENYFQVHYDLLNGKSNQYHFNNGRKKMVTGTNCIIHPSARISGTVVIGNNCIIGQDVKINGPVVIGSNCQISNYSIIDDSILWNSVHVEPLAKIKHTIIANDCHIGSGSIIEQAVLGNNTIVGYGKHIKAGQLVSPNTIVS
ncbi:MAG: NDP-sugar synthase [Dehalococcoidales bacterium]|nr:NDP-sugar synthase [Dehalococcoidales bacterium]